MLGQAQSLGCQPSDFACLCNNQNFGFGIRDCSNAICSNAGDAAAVYSFGLSFCQSESLHASTWLHGSAAFADPPSPRLPVSVPVRLPVRHSVLGV